MPFALLFIGLILLISALRGNHQELFALLKDDFSGKDNFIYWVMAIVFIVALGNIKAIKPITDAFLWLVILVILLASYRKQNLIASFLTQIKNGTS